MVVVTATRITRLTVSGLGKWLIHSSQLFFCCCCDRIPLYYCNILNCCDYVDGRWMEDAFAIAFAFVPAVAHTVILAGVSHKGGSTRSISNQTLVAEKMKSAVKHEPHTF